MFYHNSYKHVDNITCDLYQIFFKVRNLTAYAHTKVEIFQGYVNE